MLDPLRVCAAALVVAVAGCATEPPKVAPAPPPAPPPAPVVVKPQVDDKARAEEAKAMLAQAETDVQRARAKRALWLKAWEELLAARQAVAANDAEAAIRHSASASELALLGLEQLAYPAVK
jgi:hypothetical protein